MSKRWWPAIVILSLLGANACAEFDAVLSGNQIVNGKAIIKGTVKVPNHVLALPVDKTPGHALQESAAGSAIVTLTDGAGTPVPGIAQVTTDSGGQYRLDDIPPHRAYVVTATVLGKDGKTYGLKSLARTTNLFNTVDLSANTTMVTEAITASWQGLIADYNPDTFKRASEVVAINLTNETLPDMSHREAIVSAMATWVQANPPLAETLTQLRSEMAKQLPESAQVMARANPTGLAGWGSLGSGAPGAVGPGAAPGKTVINADGTATTTFADGTVTTTWPDGKSQTTAPNGAITTTHPNGTTTTTPPNGSTATPPPGGTTGQPLPGSATPTPAPTATPTPAPTPSRTATPRPTPTPTPTPRPSPTPTPVPTPTPTPALPMALPHATIQIHPRHVFKNTIVVLKKGGTVRWQNLDGEQHNIQPKPGGLDFPATGGINPGGGTSTVITFTQTGTYEYVCELHQLINAQPKIIVVD